MATLDDLTILLTMVDRTSKATKSATKNLQGIQKLTKALTAAGKVMGAAIAGGLVLATRRGIELTNGLSDLAKQTGSTLQEADALYTVLTNADPRAELEKITEAAITLSERFADARVGSGPLAGLIDDFDQFKELDLSIEGSRKQFAELLRVVNMLPSQSDKIFAIKELLGDEESATFLRILNKNAGDFNKTMRELLSTGEELSEIYPQLFTAKDAQNIEAYTDSAGRLRNAWDAFGKSIFNLVAPALTWINELFAKILNFATKTIVRIRELGLEIKKFFGFDSDIAAEGEIDRSTGPASPNAQVGVLPTRFGTFKTKEEFDAYLKTKQEIAQERIDRANTRIQGGLLDEDAAFLNGLDAAANDPNFETFGNARADAHLEMLEAQKEGYLDLTLALSGAGSAFAGFAQLAEANGSKSFKTFQRLQIAVSTVAGISAQIQALGDWTTLGTLAKFAAVARIAGIVAGGLASLKSVSVGSGGGNTSIAGGGGAGVGPAGATGGTAPATDTSQTQRQVTINITGNGNYTAEQVEELIDAINDNDTSSRISSNRIAA